MRNHARVLAVSCTLVCQGRRERGKEVVHRGAPASKLNKIMLLSIKLQYNNHLILYNFEYQCMYVYLHMFYTFYYHIQDLFKTKIKHISFTYTTYFSCKYLSNLIVLKIVFSANFELGNVVLEISLLFIINRPAAEVFDSSSDGQGEEDGDEGKDGCRAGHQPRVRTEQEHKTLSLSMTANS